MATVESLHAPSTGDVARSAPGRFYAPELDALRFLAFMLVFCRHVISGLAAARQPSAGTNQIGARVAVLNSAPTLTSLWSTVQGLAQSLDFGVCLFFFLSSFLITRLLLLERVASGTVAIRDFYIRRSLRIWPLYFVFLGLMWLLSMYSSSWEITGPRLLASAFFVANWPVVMHGWVGSPIEPLWSVAVEEQFYLIWPHFARIGKAGIVCISAVFAASSLVSLAYFGRRHGTVNTMVWPNSLVQSLFFAGGATTAVFTKGSGRIRGGAQRFILFVGGILCWLTASAGCHVVRTQSPGPGSLIAGYLLVLLGTFLIFTSFLGWRSSSMPRVVPYLGKISYGLYVFHRLCLTPMPTYVQRGFMVLGIRSVPLIAVHLVSAVLALAITIALAMLSYTYLEVPFLQLKKRFTIVQSRPA